MNPKLLVYSILFSSIIACVPATKKETTTVAIDLSNATIRKILDFRNQHNVDSLIAYMGSDDPNVRFLIAESFASMPNKSVEGQLVSLLQDKSSDVKVMAAYALGQSGSIDLAPDLVTSFKGRDTISVDNPFNGTLLEAIGKIGDAKLCRSIATVSTYRNTDTILLTNLAKAVYRFGNRGIIHPEGTEKMVAFVLDENLPSEARLYAAHYLGRVQNIDIKDYQYRIANQFVKENDSYVKMALALSLRHAKGDPDVAEILYSSLILQSDYRIKINGIKALSAFDYNDTLMSQLLKDENPFIRQAAAEYYFQQDNAELADIIIDKAKNSTDTLIKAYLYKAYLKHIPYYFTQSRNGVRYQILEILNDTVSLEQNIKFIDALGYDLASYATLEDMYDTTTLAPLKTAIATSLNGIMQNPKFDAVFSASPRYARKQMLDLAKKIVADGDVGALYELSSVFVDPTISPLLDSFNFLELALDSLDLPRDIETYNALQATLDKLAGTQSKPISLEAKPIDWSIVESYSDSTVFIVKTNKGVFQIRPFIKAAPESVINFASLVDQDFYDGKIFHRVVPNFVIQTGCTRGDGYGSLDYTINSELNQQYYNDEGYVGMASAGPNTESSQWFVTHSPTPHLDGRYTIFGKVTEGMKTVHQIEVGDTILDIIRVN